MRKRSPGEKAYEAFARVQQATGGDWRRPTPFARLQTLTQHAWEVAAQAVLEDFVSSAQRLASPPDEEETPCP